MHDVFLNSLSPEAKKIMALVKGDQIKIKRSDISTKGLIDIENAILFHLKWFKTNNLNDIPRNKQRFTIQKIESLLLMSSVYNTLAPDNPTANKVQQFVNNIPPHLLKKINFIEISHSPQKPTKKRQYHKLLFYGAELNRGRLDISACLSLINACFIFSRSDYTQDHPLPYVADINFYFGMVSLVLPFFNLATLARQFWKKHCNDLEADNKTKQFDLLFHQKRMTFTKNFLNLLLNTTTFLIGILELFPMQFYFASINIGLDFAFYCWDFYDKQIQYIEQRQLEFENLQALLETQIPLMNFDDYLQQTPDERINYLCEIYEDILDTKEITTKEDCLFLIISMISNEQKNKNAENKFYLELISFTSILIVLLVIQHTMFPPLDPELTFMMGLMVLYIYHGLKSIIMENPIQSNQESIELKDTKNESIYLKGGDVSRDPSFGHSASLDLQLILNVTLKISLPIVGMVMLLNMAPTLAIPIFLAISISIKLAEIYQKKLPIPDSEPIPTK